MTTLEILTPTHSRWPTFVAELERAIVITKHPLEWHCGGGHHAAAQVLREMGGVEIDQTLALFRAQCANCDCAILDQLAWPPRSDA